MPEMIENWISERPYDRDVIALIDGDNFEFRMRIGCVKVDLRMDRKEVKGIGIHNATVTLFYQALGIMEHQDFDAFKFK